MAKYAIWDRQSYVYTPVGEVLSPDQWKARYGWINNSSAIPVVADGIINGAFCGELSQMKSIYESQGADFSGCSTNTEILRAIEAYEDYLSAPSTESTPEERIASALEYQNIMSSEIINTDDPDL